MPIVRELIRGERDGKLSFGDYTRKTKGKKEDFEYGGDLYYVKTYDEITKLDRNGRIVYESLPGSSVTDFAENEDGVSFTVEGARDLQITLELAENTEYEIRVNEKLIGLMESNSSGKLSLFVELSPEKPADVSIKRSTR